MDATTDFVSAVEKLKGRGYVGEFRIRKGHLYDLADDKPVNLKAIQVDASYRFESAEDDPDGSNLYAVTDKDTGRKGLLIDAFDTIDQECAKEVFEQLSADQDMHREQESASIRYGLRKVFKTEFDQDPERYVLRIGFPDFPPCPFGNSFSVLGFDTAAQDYVWLVTSILRNPGLKRVPYQGDIAEEE